MTAAQPALPPLIIRPLVISDTDVICTQREATFREAGQDTGDGGLARMTASFRTWLTAHLANGDYFGFMAEKEGKAIGGIGIMIIGWPPHPKHPEQAQRGYLLNVYVNKECRKQGVARQLMAQAEATLRQRGIDYAILHATAAGRPLYETLGWSATSEMAKGLA